MGGSSVGHIANRGVEDWGEPFREALRLHGRPTERHKWFVVWARKLAARLKSKPRRQVTREEVAAFLVMLSTSPGIAPWQLAQASDCLRILIGRVFGQAWARSIRAPESPRPADIPTPTRNDTIEQLRYAVRRRNYSARSRPAPPRSAAAAGRAYRL
jgi:hypothetical protein